MAMAANRRAVSDRSSSAPPRPQGSVTIAASWVRAVIGAAERRGARSERLLGAGGLTTEGLAAGTRVPFAAMTALWRVAAQETRDPDIGLHVGQAMTPRALGVVGYVLENSRSLRDAVDRCSRYGPVLDTGDFGVALEDGRLWVRFQSNGLHWVAEAAVASAVANPRAVCRPRVPAGSRPLPAREAASNRRARAPLRTYAVLRARPTRDRIRRTRLRHGLRRGRRQARVVSRSLRRRRARRGLRQGLGDVRDPGRESNAHSRRDRRWASTAFRNASASALERFTGVCAPKVPRIGPCSAPCNASTPESSWNAGRRQSTRSRGARASPTQAPSPERFAAGSASHRTRTGVAPRPPDGLRLPGGRACHFEPTENRWLWRPSTAVRYARRRGDVTRHGVRFGRTAKDGSERLPCRCGSRAAVLIRQREEAMYDLTKFYIDGAWVAPRTKRDLDVVNPATEEVIGKLALGGPEDVDAAVAAARRASRRSRRRRASSGSRSSARSSPNTRRASPTSVRPSRTRWARP